jgi:MYXO-CTERM domain-containing protein
MGTATQKFAITLKSYGLVSGDVDSLDAALDQAKLAASDSDGDGFTDYSEIVNDVTDPSDTKSHRAIVMPPPKPDGGEGGVPGSGGAAGTPDEATGGALPECIPTKTIYPTLSYGCAFAPSDDTHGLAELGVVAMLGLARRRRRHSNHE